MACNCFSFSDQPSAILVSETLVVTAEAILIPLEAALQEAISMENFADLMTHLPADILEQEEDAKLILDSHVIPALLSKEDDGTASKATKKKKKKTKAGSASLGVVVLSASAGGMFVSAAMIKTFQQKVLPGLIADYAKERAKEIDEAEVAGAGTTTKSKPNSAKKKGRKGKKDSKTASSEENNIENSEDVVPLIRVVKSIGTEHPEMMEVDLAMKEALELTESDGSTLPQLSWENKIDNAGDGVSGDAAALCAEGLICELCRTALYSEDFVASCQRAIDLELKSLQSARLSKASVSRKDAAATVRNVESAFEEAFVDACNLLQAQAKFLQYVETDDNNKQLAEKLTGEFLRGCCADFTSRVTQYCLFKNEIDPTMFKFDSGGDGSSGSDGGEKKAEEQGALASYCCSPDVAIRQYPNVFLSLNNDGATDGESKSKDPLPRLREVLPGSVGVTLARQWIMCGGSCYQGGTKVDETGKEFTRPGDLEKFMPYVEENCL